MPAAAVQLDLFEEPLAGLAQGRRALRDFEVEAARDALAPFVEAHPRDDEGAAALEVAERFAARIVQLALERGGEVEALLAIAPEIDGEARPGWHRPLARAAERKGGSGCDVSGVPAGLHWLLGGDAAAAARSLRDTLDRRPDDARARGWLADALFRSGDVDRARWEYRRAFVDDPTVVDLGRIADPAVAGLPAVARRIYRIVGDVGWWIAAVGTVEGVFPSPHPSLFPTPPSEGAPAGLTFFHLLALERGARSLDARVMARRRMRDLSAPLLRAWIERTA